MNTESPLPVSASRRALQRLLMTVLALLGLMLLVLVSVAAASPLPNGRVWEMVSPLEKNSGDVVGIEGDNGGGVVQASSDGQAITYVSGASFAEPQGAPIGSQYVSARHGGIGWSTQNISLPTSNQTIPLGGAGVPYTAFSPDLSLGLVFGGARLDAVHPVESPPLANAPEGYENYYLREIPGGTLQPLLTQAHVPNVLPQDFRFAFLGASSDLGHLVLRSSAALGANPAGEPGNSNLYEWDRASGQFSLVNVLPDGTTETAHFVSLGGIGPGEQDRAISSDGSHVVWTRGGSSLFVRKDIGTGQAKTIQADAPAEEGLPGGEGIFLGASSDGSKVFFADGNRLTGDSTASAGGYGDLYMFEPDAPEGSRLVDLTVDTNDPMGAEVQGVVGASEDGSYLYFVANGVLAPGASPGSCAPGARRPQDRCNLYLWHDSWGQPRFVAQLSGNDERATNFNSLGVAFDWSRKVGRRTTRVSHDGTSLVFMSELRLTNYNNTVSTGSSCGTDLSRNILPASCEEVFLYEAEGEGHLSCISCNPNGAQPIGPSGIPGGTDFQLANGQYQSRVLSEGVDGARVLFDSADALVPQDINGKEDVYEYEGGHTYLLSDGRSSSGAAFVDASANGDDVFFITRSELVGQDTDQLVDLYDARAPHAAGETLGFPVPSAPTPCGAEDCRPFDRHPPAFAPLSSVQFTGLGNVGVRRVKHKKHKKKASSGSRKAHAGRLHAAKRGR